MTVITVRRRKHTPSGLVGNTGARVWTWLSAVVLLVLCADIGVSVGQSGFATPTLLRLALLFGILLTVVLLARFELFLLLVLLLRPVLDITTVGGRPPVLASGVAALVVLGVVFWLAAQLRARTLGPVSVLGQLAVLLLVVMSLSAVLSADPVRGVLQVARLAAAVAVFLAVEQLLSRGTPTRRVLLACYLSAVVPLAVGLYQLSAGSYLKTSGGLGRVTGTFVHPNAFGFYLVLLLVMGAAALRHLHGTAQWVVGLVLVGGAVELLLTYSRGSWLALIAGLLVVGVLQSRKLLVLLPVGLALVPVLAPSVLQRLSDLSETQSINGTPGNSLFWRLDHWGVVLRGARGHELLGIGPGASDFLGETVLPPHNDFVRMYVETGMIGLLVYTGLLVAALSMGLRGLRAARGRDFERGLAVGALGCTVAFLVGSVGGNLISQIVVLLYLFTFLAIASAAEPDRRTSPRPNPAPQADRHPVGALAPESGA